MQPDNGEEEEEEGGGSMKGGEDGNGLDDDVLDDDDACSTSFASVGIESVHSIDAGGLDFMDLLRSGEDTSGGTPAAKPVDDSAVADTNGIDACLWGIDPDRRVRARKG